MPAGAVVLFGSYALLLRRDPIARRVLKNLSLSIHELPRILSYSAMMFATVALTNVGLTAVRAKVLLEAGASANGYLQTVTSLAAYTLAFVTTGFWGHMHARGAAKATRRKSAPNSTKRCAWGSSFPSPAAAQRSCFQTISSPYSLRGGLRRPRR